jgi:NAD(P)-dependent dehydrogenase (short-subunit alcohol dehydrogenase family)
MFDLTGKVALVTGGTSGIGRAAALALAGAGARVVLSGRREKEGEAVVAEIVKGKGTAHFVRADVAVESEVANLVRQTVATFGKLDIAFNNAGVESVASLLDFDVETYRRVFDINVLGVFLALKYEIPEMLKAGGGAIVNTSSVGGHVGMSRCAIYSATKFAVEGITKSAALEFAKQGIRVNAVAPAAIVTEMIDRFTGGERSEAGQKLASQHPVGRMGQAEEVAAAILYLVSDEAKFVTGVSLPVDGGWLAR